jgi:HlyD family secretion protein
MATLSPANTLTESALAASAAHARIEAPPSGQSLPTSRDPAQRQARQRRHKIVRGVRHALLALLLIAAAGGIALALRPRPVPVDVASVVRGPLVVAVEETGVTRIKDRYLVSAPVTGRISRVVLEPGDPVREGDTLAEIAPAPSPLLDERTRAEGQAKLAAAISGLGQARAQEARAAAAQQLAAQELARARRLAAEDSITPRELDQAEFAARMRDEELTSAAFAGKVATEEVRLSRVALARYGAAASPTRHVDVLAPTSGRVLRVHQKSAGVVQAGTPLLEVGDASALEVVVDLLTTDAVHVKPGTAVVLEGWGGDQPLSGRVRKVEPSAFTKLSALGVEEQRVNVLISFADGPAAWSALGDGYRTEARLVLWQGANVVTVPQGAVFRHGDGWAVFRLERGVARLAQVSVGHRGDSAVEVTSGLQLGQSVLVHPGDRVKDGARVEPR